MVASLIIYLVRLRFVPTLRTVLLVQVERYGCVNRARSASAASEFETLGIETAFQSAKTDTNNLSNPTSSGRGSWYPPSELRRRQLDAATTSRAASGFSRRLPWILDADAGFGRRVRAPL